MKTGKNVMSSGKVKTHTHTPWNSIHHHEHKGEVTAGAFNLVLSV